MAGRRAFYVDVEGSNQTTISLGERTFTNLGSSFNAWANPSLNVQADDGVRSASFEVYVPGDALPSVGTHDASGVDIALDGEGCTPTSGTYTIVDLQTEAVDGGFPPVTKAVLWFDLVCPTYDDAGDTVRGCIKYAPDEVADADAGDAGAPPVDASAEASLVSPCESGHYVIAVETDNGSKRIDDSVGDWSSRVTSESYMQLGVTGTDARWAVAATMDLAAGPLRPGTYTSTGSSHSTNLIVAAGGENCTSATGTFTIYELEYPPSDQSNLTRLLMDFNLNCGTHGYRGCVSYGR